MSDTRHAHEFNPSRKGRCQTIIGRGICSLSYDAPAHARWRKAQKERDEEAAQAAGLETQRLWDLVRHQRMELHTAGLITDDEYAALAEDHAAVARLEAYDATTARLEDWKKAVYSLTPGGSEFINDPAYCARYIRERTNWPRMLRETRGALDAIQADPHQWSPRPCETCQKVSDALGSPFGCLTRVKPPEERRP